MIVYKTTNTINGKVYIGKDRKNNPKYLGSGKLLYLAIKKYGVSAFKKEILFESDDENEINAREKIEIEKHKGRDICYNLAEGGTGGYTTKYYTEAEYNIWRANLSKSSNHRKFTEETKLKISLANKGKFYGDKNKISMTLKDIWKDPNSIFNSKEYREKLSTAAKGRPCKEETKLKISKSNSGSNNGMAIRLEIDGRIFGTRRDAAKEYNISETAVTKRCKSKNFPTWKLL
jgi:group I intron endonuclease